MNEAAEQSRFRRVYRLLVEGVYLWRRSGRNGVGSSVVGCERANQQNGGEIEREDEDSGMTGEGGGKRREHRAHIQTVELTRNQQCVVFRGWVGCAPDDGDPTPIHVPLPLC
jgi:hypothetical protein